MRIIWLLCFVNYGLGFAMRLGFSWIKCVGVSGLCALALVGCNRQKEQPKQVEPQSQSEQVADVPTIVDCKSDAMIQQMHDSMLAAIHRHVEVMAASINQNTVPDRNKLNGKIANLSVHIQNIRQGNSTTGMDTCQASVSVMLANSDIFRANQMFVAANQPSLEQKLAENNIQLNNNILVDDDAEFVISKNNNNAVEFVSLPLPLIQQISHVIVNAALKESIDAEQMAHRRQIQQQIAQEQKARQAAQERLAAQQIQELEQAQAQQEQLAADNANVDINIYLDSGNDNPPIPTKSVTTEPNSNKITSKPNVQDTDNIESEEFNVPGADEVTIRIIEKDETY